MKTLIETMELYAAQHDVPIMEPAGISFIRSFIETHQIVSILEIGSAIGYSAIQMALVNPLIRITTVEKDEERYQVALNNIYDTGLGHQINIVCGDAFSYVPEQSYDLIFIDAAKAKYQQFFCRFAPYLNPKGFLLSDNMEFHGMVKDPSSIKTRGTRRLVQRIGEYQEFLRNHAGFDTTFLQIGDGVAVTTRKPMTFHAVIFDMDGLMIDTERLFISKCYEANDRYELPLNDAFFEQIIGRNRQSIEVIFAEQYPLVSYDTWSKDIRGLMNQVYEEEGVPHMPGIVKMLEWCKSAKIKVAVATSTHHASAMKLLERANLLSYFDILVAGDMVSHSKPDPEIFLKAANLLGVDPKTTLVLEDSNAGVEAALAGGFMVVMVVDILQPTASHEQRANAIVNSLEDVYQLVK